MIELTNGADLIVPYSVHWEIGNAFSAMLKRKRITLKQALKANEGKVKIKSKHGQIFIITPEFKTGSPLDIESIDLGITTTEIIDFIYEGRKLS
ncbi:MAG: hypothetical protein ACE5EA_05065 [Nitrospirota bacterium]